MKKFGWVFITLGFFLISGLAFSAQETSLGEDPSSSPELNPFPGLAPLKPTPVRLKSQHVRVKIFGDGVQYQTHAIYTLTSDQPNKVPFGVPLPWMSCPDYWACRNPKKITPLGEKFAKKIKISLNGKKIPCTLRGTPKDPDNPFGILGWCEGVLPVPAGNDNRVEVKYRSMLDYAFLTNPSVGLTLAGRREIKLPIVSFNNWNGTIDLSEIEFDMGHLAKVLKINPPLPTSKKGEYHLWIFQNVDPKNPPMIHLSVQDEDYLKFLEIAYWNRTHDYNWKARASSEYHSAGYLIHSAHNAVDGRIETAWCENSLESGTGEWIKIRYRNEENRKKSRHCHLKGFGIIPGFARDQDTYDHKNKITQLEIYNCLDPTLGKQTVDISPAKLYSSSAKLIPYTLPEFKKEIPPSRQEDADCVYIKITGAQPSNDRNISCLTEVAPILLCE